MAGTRKRATPAKSAPTKRAPAKAGRRTRLIDPGVVEAIVEAIEGGAFDYQAAQAAGVAPATFREWMARAEGRHDRPSTPELAAFAAKVGQARAKARLVAEQTVFRENPLSWLRYGPGRERPGAPGWTNANLGVKVEETRPDGNVTTVRVVYVDELNDDE